MIQKEIRILHILDSLSISSGVANVILNWHRNIDRTKIQFDYLCFKDITPNFEEEIKSLGGKFYKLPYPSLKNPWIFIKTVRDFFKTNKYSIIHSHVTQMNFFFYPIAHYYGVKNIIQHSHATKWSGKFLNGLRNKFLFFWVRPFIDKKLACSNLAGRFLLKDNYIVINNGIDLKIFKFNQTIRNKIRKELNIENKFVVGHVGRFSQEKNHNFLVDIFNEINKKNRNSALLLVGDGPLNKEIEQKINKLNLANDVIFTGIKNNVSDYYQAMDVFVLPSFQEGLGLSVIEAESLGVPCFISDEVPDEAMICNTTKICLNKSSKEWSEIILEKIKNFKRKDCSNLIKDVGYDIKETTMKIENIYLQLNGDKNG